VRVFIDVGGYQGHSTLAALDPIFGFHRIYCFEPVPDLARRLRDTINDCRVVVIQACLSNRDGTALMYHAGTLAGTIFEDGPSYGGEGFEVVVPTISAASFAKSCLAYGDFVRIKLNCEGAEIDIIEDLIQARSEALLENALIDFDARKVASLKARLVGVISQLDTLGVCYLTPPQCQYGMVTNFGGVRNYLLCSGARKQGLLSTFRSFIYNLKCAFNPEINGYHKMRVLRWVPLLRALQRSK
jgi:FkbM family methyltransferase